MRKLAGIFLSFALISCAIADSDETIKQKAKELLEKLTFEEKVHLTWGDFYSGGVPRLKIQPLGVTDGPVGIRIMNKKKKNKAEDEVFTTADIGRKVPTRTSALPSTISLAATFDRQAAYDYSSIIADEVIALEKHVLLGPGLNMMRDPDRLAFGIQSKTFSSGNS